MTDKLELLAINNDKSTATPPLCNATSSYCVGAIFEAVALLRGGCGKNEQLQQKSRTSYQPLQVVISYIIEMLYSGRMLHEFPLIIMIIDYR